MPTKRKPVARHPRRVITPEMVDIFRRTEAPECTPEEHGKLDSMLRDLLGSDTGTIPCYEKPDAVNPYPPGHANHRWWIRYREQRPQAFKLYEELKAAVPEAID